MPPELPNIFEAFGKCRTNLEALFVRARNIGEAAVKLVDNKRFFEDQVKKFKAEQTAHDLVYDDLVGREFLPLLPEHTVRIGARLIYDAQASPYTNGEQFTALVCNLRESVNLLPDGKTLENILVDPDVLSVARHYLRILDKMSE